MAERPTHDEQELPAYPIRAYQLIPDPNQPAVVALAIETDQGHSLFLATPADPGRSGQGPAGAGGEDAAQAGEELTIAAAARIIAASQSV